MHLQKGLVINGDESKGAISNHYQYFIREGEEGGLGNRVRAYGQGHLCKNYILVIGLLPDHLCN